MSSKDDSKPGFFKRLFGGSKKSSGSDHKSASLRVDGSESSSGHKSGSVDHASSSTRAKPSHSPLLAPPVKTRTPSSGSSGTGKNPSAAADAAASKQARKPRRQTSGQKSKKHRKRTKAMIDPGAIKVCLYSLRFYRATLCVSAVFAVIRRPSVRSSVRLSVTFECCIQTAEDIVELLCRPGSPIILVFRPQAPIFDSKGNPSSEGANTPGGHNLRYWTEIAVYLGNGTRYAHGCYGTLIGSHRRLRGSVLVAMTLSDF